MLRGAGDAGNRRLDVRRRGPWLAAGREAIEGLRLGVGARALNATRSELGSGIGEDVERLLEEVEVRDIESQAG